MKFVKYDKNLVLLWSATGVAGALFVSACGGGSDLACGAGTEQKGDQCVAKAEVTKSDSGLGDAADASTDSAVPGDAADASTDSAEIGRASCREKCRSRW